MRFKTTILTFLYGHLVNLNEMIINAQSIRLCKHNFKIKHGFRLPWDIHT